MDFEWTEEHTKNTVVGIILLILLFVLTIAFFVGRDLARAEYAVKQTYELMTGLEYFYADNDRYPAEAEFASSNPMAIYFVGLPLKPVLSKKCPEGIQYETFDRLTYRFSFCIPRTYGSWREGQNTVDQFDNLTGVIE